MAVLRLNPKLLAKLSQKVGKPTKYLREQICRRANRCGISSEAALILWAKENGIGTASYQRALPAGIQEEVRNSLPSMFAPSTITRCNGVAKPRAQNRRSEISAAIEYLLEDQELRDRCDDLLKAKKHYDRAFREATTVFDDRLKKLTGITNMMPQDLIGKVFNPDPTKAVIIVSSNRAEQEGFYNICKGVGLSFRNPTHHNLSNKFTRQDAMKFCGFVDAILSVISQGKLCLERC